MKKTLFLMTLLFCYYAKAQTDLILDWAINPQDSVPAAGTINSTDVMVNATDERYVCGLFSEGGDFDPSVSFANILVSNGGNDAFLAKYDASGNYIWAFQLGSLGNDVASSLSVDASGNVVLLGKFEGTVDFNPLGAESNMTSNGGEDIFLAKYDPSGNLVWCANFGGVTNDYATSVIVDGSDHIYITGNISGTADFDPGAGVVDLIPYMTTSLSQYLAKYDSGGNLVWAHLIDAVASGGGKSMTFDNASNIVLTGNFYGTTDFDPSASLTSLTSSASDAFIAKYDILGNFLWVKAIEAWNLTCQGVDVDTNDDIIISGTYSGEADFDPSPLTEIFYGDVSDIFVAKYTPVGDFEWVFQLSNFESSSNGGVITDVDNNIYITGGFTNSFDFDPDAGIASSISNGLNDIYLAKYNSLGAFLWADSYGAPNSDLGRQVTLSNADNPIITGQFMDAVDFDASAETAILTASTSSVFASQYNSAGTYDHAIGIGLLPEVDALQTVNASDTDSDGNVYVIGWLEGTVDLDPSADDWFINGNGYFSSYLVKYDSNGVFQWGFAYAGNDDNNIVRDVKVDANDDVIVTGVVVGDLDMNPLGTPTILTSAGNGDIFLAKYSENGMLIWVNQFGDTNGDSGYGLAIDNSNDIILGGSFSQTVDFDPSADVANRVTPTINPDPFIAKYTTDGDYIWAVSFSCNNIDYCRDVAVDDDNNIYGIGWFQGTMDFDPSAGVDNHTPVGSVDNFLVKLDAEGNYQWVNPLGGLYMEDCYDVEVDHNNDVLMTGYFTNNMDFNPQGAPDIRTSLGWNDIFVGKYDGNGDLVWVKTFGGDGTQTDGAYDLDINSSNEVYMAGRFQNDMDIDTMTPDTYMTSNGSSDAFLAKLGEDGDYLWSYNFGNIASDGGAAVSIDEFDNIFFSGNFRKIMQFNVVGSYFAINASNDVDAFIARYHEGILDVTGQKYFQNSEMLSVLVYPNPTNGNVNLKFSKDDTYMLRVLALDGSILSQYDNVTQGFFEFNLEGVPGIYLLEVNGIDNKSVYKIIKQ